MTPEYLETIFDAFTRAENSTTNKVQGTGLGMAITKSIVELMGGTIEVSSEVDRGSLFGVELELRIQEEQADRQFWTERGISQILAVDGDEESRENMRALMAETGVRLEAVSSLEEALEYVRRGGDCQIVLLDWDMPDLSAVQAAEKLREVLSEIPILFLAEHDGEGLEETLQISRAGLLGKPFFVAAFREKVEELWKRPEDGKAAEPEKDGNLEGLRFLAAEDNEINGEILAELLEIEGASCEIVENGLLAVERFRQSAQGEFDAILMDVQMPVMNGHDATRAIRALEREDAKHIPIVAMTANAFAEDEKAALDAGMNAHVAKPLDVKLLKKVLRRYIGWKDTL